MDMPIMISPQPGRTGNKVCFLVQVQTKSNSPEPTKTHIRGQEYLTWLRSKNQHPDWIQARFNLGIFYNSNVNWRCKMGRARIGSPI